MSNTELFTVRAGAGFDASHALSHPGEGLTIIHVRADAAEEAAGLELILEWQVPDPGVHTIWSPLNYQSKTIMPNWGGYAHSCAMSGAPVYSAVDGHDGNVMTIACADAKNAVRIHTGLIEENGCFDCRVIINVGCAMTHYETDVRVDTRSLPFYQAVADVVTWWESYDGYTPAPVPDDAKQPLYSAWYSYHQQIDVDGIVDECAYFSKLGAKVLIVDDGWQTDDNARGYDYCGDWQPTSGKVPSMKEFVDRVHETGMKFMLWYSVPYVGEYTEAYKRFSDKMLYLAGSKTHVVDPRYPEIREYLISLYRNAVLEWGLDGFKLDFVDSFRQTGEFREGMDYVSVFDAVDRLMKDVVTTLSALNPDILLEFRQAYIGPLMRTFGNMFRSGDCPADSYTNRLNTLSLRMTSGNTAVHSDMVMWHYDQSAEEAAYQLTSVLFAVPQISVRQKLMTDEQKEMVAAYLALWETYRDVLMNGEMLYKGYANNYPYVSARRGNVQVGAVYGGLVAYVEVPTDEMVLVNATDEAQVLIRFPAGLCARYAYEIRDCRGRACGNGELTTDAGIAVIGNVPVNGVITLTVRSV